MTSTLPTRLCILAPRPGSGSEHVREWRVDVAGRPVRGVSEVTVEAWR